MAPPASVSSPRPHHPSVHATPGYSSYSDATASFRNASQAPTLYSSILAPPPTKLARTIHNPNDPPVPAPSRPHPSPRSRVSKASPRNDPARPQAKSKQTTKASKPPPSPDKRRTKRGSLDKGKQKRRADDMDVDEGDDMKAAAALTSLLMQHRPSIAGSASSPRSSIDGSEVGSAYSFSNFVQPSARAATASLSAAPSLSNLAADPGDRTQTPPPPGSNKQHTPRPAPTDSEAANLMLFLATSPSPVRPANKDSKDMAAYRALGGGTGPLRSKGRVLFPSTSAADPVKSGHEDASMSSGGASFRSPGLTRGGDNSFASSISSIGGELGGGIKDGTSEGSSSQSLSTLSGVGSANSSSGSIVSQLLPPAPLPLPTAPTSPAGRKDVISNPRPNPAGVSGGNSIGGPLEFNFHEFIHASPSSPRSTHGHGTGSHKANLGLRADVGRKLFEEEQMRHAHAHAMQAAAAVVGNPGRQRQDDRALGAGIDLIHS